MRRTLVLSIVTATALALGCSASAGEHAVKPALKVLDRTPLVVRGTNFRRSELVRVTYRSTGEPVVRKARTGTAGGFTVRFPEVSVHPCSGGATIIARGSSGTFALAKLPAPLCPPAP